MQSTIAFMEDKLFSLTVLYIILFIKLGNVLELQYMYLTLDTV